MASWSVGRVLGRYELLARIGAGGMGEVWKARDSRLNRIVAIKRLTTPHARRFEQEARAIASLNHPNICQIHDVGPDYLVLEFVDGAPLQCPYPASEAVRLAEQIASALEAAHAQNIVHRDLKPGNILVTTDGTVKLLDFGLAMLTAAPDSGMTQTATGTISGTAAYMSPEQAQGRPLDARSDLFSFGAVLYHLLRSELDLAAAWYEKAIEQRELFAIICTTAPIVRPLRESAYWPRLARLMNMSDRP